MSAEMMGLWGIVALLVAMMLLKVPPGFAMAIIGFGGIVLLRSFQAASSIMVTELWGKFGDYGLTVIPLFILMGELIFYGGYSDGLYATCYRWLGHRRGGLAMASVMACAGFAAICGSNTATAATMSAVAIPSMRRYKYHPTLMSGAVAAGSTLGVMIPPSIVLVVYSLNSNGTASIGKLFIGTLIPGLLLTALFVATVAMICARHPQWGPPGERSTWRQRLASVPAVIDVLLLFIAVMAAMFSGLTTATESAAVGCAVALLMCVLRGRLSMGHFKAAMHHTLRISCMVFMIVVGAVIFGRFLTITTLPGNIAAAIGAMQVPGWVVILLILGIFVIGGCLMDALAFLLISMPIFFPLVHDQLGYDAVWFGVLLCLVTTLGAITPPVGICCFVIAGMHKDIPMEQVFKGSMYYLPAYVLTGLLMMLFPYYTVLWLANWVN